MKGSADRLRSFGAERRGLGAYDFPTHLIDTPKPAPSGRLGHPKLHLASPAAQNYRLLKPHAKWPILKRQWAEIIGSPPKWLGR